MARPALRRAPIASAQQGLRLFKVAQNREILIALDARGPSTRSDLSRWLVASSRTKLGECLKELVEAGVVEEQDGRARTFALTTAGQHLVAIIDLVSDWFR